MKWYKRDPEAALVGMRGLTSEEVGFYATLLDLMYSTDDRVPNDDQFLTRFFNGINVRTVRRLKARLIALGKLTIGGDGFLHNGRVSSEIHEWLHRMEVRRRRRSLGRSLGTVSGQFEHSLGYGLSMVSGQFEHKKGEKVNKNNADNLNKLLKPQPQPQPQPQLRKKESKTLERSPSAPGVSEKAFQEFWQAYPKRSGANPKHPARKSFLSGLKAGAAPEEIIRSVRAFASAESDKIGTPYIPQAVTWLNQRRWQDYAPVEEKPSGPIGWRPGLPTHEELLAGGTNERTTQAPGGNLRSESNRVYESGNGKAGQGTERSDLSNNQARKSGMVSLGSVFQRVSGLRANGHDPDQK